jgi:hypothetical protein
VVGSEGDVVVPRSKIASRNEQGVPGNSSVGLRNKSTAGNDLTSSRSDLILEQDHRDG